MQFKLPCQFVERPFPAHCLQGHLGFESWTVLFSFSFHRRLIHLYYLTLLLTTLATCPVFGEHHTCLAPGQPAAAWPSHCARTGAESCATAVLLPHAWTT